MNKFLGVLGLAAALFILWKFFLVGMFAEEVGNGKPIAIAELKQHIREYQGKIVTIEGEVASSGSVVLGGYRVDDGTAIALVLTTKGVPNKGEHLKVRGVVNQLAKVGATTEITITEKADKEQ
jgi:hypothetical protein